MKNLSTLFFSACLVSVAVGSVAVAGHFHVAKSGSDDNDGSEASPLATISAAAQLAHPGDVITVHEGIYRERITPPRGGTSDTERIVYQAAEDQSVEIRGSEVVDGWQRVSGGVWKVTLPASMFGDYNPYSTLIAGDWFNAQGREHHTGAVYLAGESLWEAASREDVMESPNGEPHWYAEVEGEKTMIWAHFGEANPNDGKVEINVRPTCFYPEEPGINFITIRGFTMRHAATQWAPPTAEQIGLIGTHWSKGWVIENNTIRDSRCTGITLGKYDDPEDRVEASADQYNETIRQALAHGWSKENIGSHVVRNNEISHCEQAGMCGSMGAIFCLIEGNYIHDIWVKRQFSGAEIGGIKFHGAVDTIIRDNHIHHAGRGLWLDWMTQGTRVTGNLLYENTTDDLFVEVNHGPFLVDNNIMLSPLAVRNWSEGGAYVHNLIEGEVALRPVLGRSTPVLEPHGTDVVELRTTEGGDDRWYNNIFISSLGLVAYDEAKRPVQMAGNVFLGGSKPAKQEEDAVVLPNVELSPEVEGNPKQGFTLKGLERMWVDRQKSPLVTTALLGKAELPRQGFTGPDGSSLKIDRDYAGRPRNVDDPAPGPFAAAEWGQRAIKVWPKSNDE